MKFVIIGYGVMGSAIIKRAISAGVVRRRECTIVEKGMDPVVACRDVHVVLFAVKPQDAPTVFAALRGKLRPQTLVISIMAGVSLESLKYGLVHGRVIRAMPNTPARIGEGMTVWTSSRSTSAGDRAFAQKLFRALGKELHVKNQKYIDSATAVSGSGPAYVFAFVESLIATAQELGFTKKSATLLVYQTLRGSSALLEASMDDAATLRARVTSKKGTTSAALAVLQKHKMTRIWRDAVFAAHARARQMAKGYA